MFKIGFIIAACIVAVAVAQPPSTCSNIQLGTNTFDLSWWSTQGPFTKMDPTGQYTLQFSLCSALPDACPDNADGGQSSRCAQPGSAGVCQTWTNVQNPNNPYHACAASAKATPAFAPYNGDGMGVVMTVGGGDDCGVCSPEARATAFTIVCDASTTANIISVSMPDVPSPVYNVLISHCTGCPTTDPRFCASNTANIAVDAQFVGNSGSIALLPPASPLQASTQTGADLLVEGTVLNALNNTVNFLVSSGSSLAQASLSFPGSKVVALSLVDKQTGKAYPCGAGKAPRGKYVNLACNMGASGVVVVSGSVL